MIKDTDHIGFMEVFEKQVNIAISEEVAKIGEKIIADAKVRLEKEIKNEIAQTAIRIARFADIQMMNDRLVIEIRMPKG